MTGNTDGVQGHSLDAVNATSLDATTVPTWSDTFTAAQTWIRWTARRRWPHFPANDDVWALSITAWEHGGLVCTS